MAKTSAEEAINRHYLGGKPELSKIVRGTPEYDLLYKHALEWGRYCFDADDLKDYACEKFGESYRKYPSWRFLVIGRQAWMLLGGAKLSEPSMQWINEQLEMIKLSKIEELDENLVEFEDSTISTNELNMIVFNNTFPVLDSICSNKNFNKEEIKNILSKVHKNKVLKLLLEYYQERLTDIHRHCPDDLILGQQIFGIREIVSQITYLLKFTQVERSNGIIENHKKAEKVLEKKNVKSSNKLENIDVSNVKFKLMDPFTGIVSKKPNDIVTAKAVALYNSHKRTIGIIYASKDELLTIKGTTIHNIDESKSFCKTCRDPKKAMASLQNADRIERYELIIKENISGNLKEINGRLNDETLILNVWK